MILRPRFFATNSASAVAYRRLRETPSRLPNVSPDSNSSSGIDTAIFILWYYHGRNHPGKLAHFHAVHGQHKITVEIESGTVRGEFPPRALRLVLEWAQLHKQELVDDWERARRREPLERIAPLE